MDEQADDHSGLEASGGEGGCRTVVDCVESKGCDFAAASVQQAKG